MNEKYIKFTINEEGSVTVEVEGINNLEIIGILSFYKDLEQSRMIIPILRNEKNPDEKNT